jgi:hypothetical protein
MFKFLRSDPKKQVEKKIAHKLERARDVQRSGDLKAYARLMEEIDEMQAQLEKEN